MSDQFRRDESDGVVTITFTRDDKLNAVSEQMLDGLRSAVHDLAERDDLQVLVITAEGRYFTAGIDIGGLPTQRSEYGTSVRRDYRKLHLLFDEFEAVEKPVVLAAQGPCLGVGVEMASSCDFRLAADSAIFGLPEVVNLAVIPGSGGISRLTRLIGPHWARWIALACQNIDAEHARQIGFVHEVVAAGDFAARVQAFARELAALPRDAVGLAKLAIDAAADSDRVTARNMDRIANTALITSEDHISRVRAFTAKSAAKK
jgi:enoyl-CoA hydratase/carnithine racemase